MADSTPKIGRTLQLPILNRSVQRIAFGCEPLGGYNWGHVDISAIEAAIEAALEIATPEKAILFDTSDTYGPHLSEERLGQCLAGRREATVLATKFGVRLADGRAFYDTSPAYVDRALDASLSRLGTDQIDLYQMHWPDAATPLADTLSALERFRAEGRIGAYGVSNVAPRDLTPHLEAFPGLASFSLGYSLLDREREADILALCDRGLVFLAYGALAQGLLSGKYGADTVFEGQDRRNNPKYRNFHGERLTRNLAIVESLKSEAVTLGVPVPALALGFVLAKLDRSISLAGIKSVDQWYQNLSALDVTLTTQGLARVERMGQP